ncbi:MAG: tetratricopeptide repeat protein, partial [Terriglobia bacterium]
LDFGVAKLLPQAEGAATTETGDTEGTEGTGGGIGGTPGYMAPEVLLDRDSDGRADIFSLGVVFYEALTGKHPFWARSRQAIYNRSLHETPLRPTLLNPKVPAELERIVTKMLAKPPEERYATAADLLVDLRALQRGPQWWQFEWQKQKKRRRLVAAVASIAVLIGLLLGLNVSGLRDRLRDWLSPPVERVRVAVLPFVNATGDERLEQYQLPLTGALVSDLTGSANIWVLPYDQLWQYVQGIQAAGGDISGPEARQTVATLSNARYLVVPKMSAMGDNLWITAEIWDAGTRETVHTVKVEQRRSGSAEDTFYALRAELSDPIQEYFKEVGPGEEYQRPPEGSVPQTASAQLHFTNGKNYLAQGSYAEALQAFERVTEQDPDFPLAYAWMAYIYGLLGYDDKAREFSEEAARRITPQTPTVDGYFIEAIGAESRYDFATAEAKYLELIRFYPDEAVWYASLAKVYEKQGQFEEAITRYQTARQRESNYIAAHQGLGTLYRKTGDLEQAIAQAERALELCRALRNREGEANALLELSEIFRLKGEYEQARDYAQQGLEIFQELDRDVGISLASLRLGNLRYQQRDYEGARGYWQQVVSIGGEIRNNHYVVTALMNIGVSYEYEGDLAQSIAYYERALSKEWPAGWEQAQVKTNLAVIYIQYGVDPEQGLQLAQEALGTFQQMGDRHWQGNTHIVLTGYYRNTAQYPRALDHIQQAQAIFQSTRERKRLAWAMEDAGRVHFVRNQYEEARRAFAQALDLAGELGDDYRAADSRILLGWTYQRLGDPTQARTLLEEGLQASLANGYDDFLPEAYAAWGDFYWGSGEPEQARASFQQVPAQFNGVGLSEYGVEARSNLGLLEAEQGNRGRGLLYCRQAVAQARRLKSVHTLARTVINFARVRVLRKEYGQAIQALEEIISLDQLGLEFRAQAYYTRGQALEGLGQTEEAETSQEQAREAIRQLQQTLASEHRESFINRPEIQALLR